MFPHEKQKTSSPRYEIRPKPKGGLVFDMGMSENVGLIFPMIASHFSKRDNDQQNHWVQWGTQHFQTNPYVHDLGILGEPCGGYEYYRNSWSWSQSGASFAAG